MNSNVCSMLHEQFSSFIQLKQGTLGKTFRINFICTFPRFAPSNSWPEWEKLGKERKKRDETLVNTKGFYSYRWNIILLPLHFFLFLLNLNDYVMLNEPWAFSSTRVNEAKILLLRRNTCNQETNEANKRNLGTTWIRFKVLMFKNWIK